MKTETLFNLIWMAIWVILCLIALIVAIFYYAHWHYFSAGICFVMAILFYKDDAYGCESVKHYFEKVARAKRIR